MLYCYNECLRGGQKTRQKDRRAGVPAEFLRRVLGSLFCFGGICRNSSVLNDFLSLLEDMIVV